MNQKEFSLKIYENEIAPQSLIDDITEFCNTDSNKINCILTNFTPKYDVKPSELTKLISKNCNTTEKSVDTIIRIAYFLYRKVREKAITFEDLNDDLKLLGLESNFGKIETVYETIGTEFVDKMKKYRTIMKEVSLVVPNLARVDYNSNLRLIVDKEGKEIEWIPISQILIKVENYPGNKCEKSESICFQVTLNELDKLIEDFGKMRKEMKLADECAKKVNGYMKR